VPRNNRDVEKLTSRLAALHCFLSTFSFFKNFYGVEKKEEFWWINKYRRAFKELRVFLERLLLTCPVKGEELYLYLTTLDEAISLIFVRESKI